MNELSPLISELCYLAMLRNEINTRRHRARFRKNYYAKAIRIVEAHNQSNSELRSLHIDKHSARIRSIKHDMAKLIEENPKPKKWQKMGLHKLRSLALKGAGEYALAKHEIMELSIRERSRVKYISNQIDGHMIYDNGSIIQINLYSCQRFEPKIIGLEEMKHYATQYELNKAVDSILISDPDTK